MNSKVLLTLVFLTLATFGCIGVESTRTLPPVVTQPPAAPPTLPAGGEATVESIEILILESFPVQVHVVARGYFPDGCTSVDQIIHRREGNTFVVTITTARPAGVACTDAIVPFEEIISLDVYGLAAGAYTVTVNGVSGTFDLAVDNVPQAEPPIAPSGGTIAGVVWHDLCKVPYETVAEPPEGCVKLPDGGLVANSLLEEGEPGLEGVVVMLGAGACPSTGLATATTDADGMYTFAGLSAGIFCVSIDFLDSTNETILIPGGWTYPNQEGSATVTIGSGEERLDVNFGWDYQFLP